MLIPRNPVRWTDTTYKVQVEHFTYMLLVFDVNLYISFNKKMVHLSGSSLTITYFQAQGSNRKTSTVMIIKVLLKVGRTQAKP